jgi:hypothetical protein
MKVGKSYPAAWIVETRDSAGNWQPWRSYKTERTAVSAMMHAMKMGPLTAEYIRVCRFERAP